ncbi:MAG TPA: type II secretion system protein [Candidatus Saccharimonadales bacterium]
MEKNGGFTLVEILITILVLGVSVASLSSIFISIHSIQVQSSRYDTAHRAAARQIEALRNNSFATLTAGQTINFTNDLPEDLPDRNGVATISAPSDGLRRVDATVTYTTGGESRSVTLSSLIGEIGITQ